MVVAYRYRGRPCSRAFYDLQYCDREAIGVRNPDHGIMNLDHEAWLREGWTPVVPEPQRFVCPYCILHESQVIDCFKGQLECMVCGMAVCYAASQPGGDQAVPVITPAQKVLDDAASSYAGDRAEEPDMQETGPSPGS